LRRGATLSAARRAGTDPGRDRPGARFAAAHAGRRHRGLVALRAEDGAHGRPTGQPHVPPHGGVTADRRRRAWALRLATSRSELRSRARTTRADVGDVAARMPERVPERLGPPESSGCRRAEGGRRAAGGVPVWLTAWVLLAPALGLIGLRMVRSRRRHDVQ